MSKTLEGVKPGDKIKVMRYWSAQFYSYTVERVTATRAVCVCGTSFKIDSGLMVGTGNCKRSYGSFLTDEDRKSAELESRIKGAAHEIAGIRITDANLEAAEAFIAASTKKEKAE